MLCTPVYVCVCVCLCAFARSGSLAYTMVRDAQKISFSYCALVTDPRAAVF